MSEGRRGGREARKALRAAAPEADRRAVRSGLSGGAYKPLSESALIDIYETAIHLLEEIGMGSPIPDFIRVVTEAGGTLGDDGRLRFPRRLVEWAIATAAKSFTWHGFDESLGMDLSDTKVHFGTAGAAVLMLDHETQRFRHSSTADLFDLSRLADTLDNLHFFVRPVVTRELTDVRELDLNTAYATMMGTTKPTGTSFFKPEHVYEAVEMFDIALGGEGEFRRRPFMVANNTFVVPPMRYAEESAECMVAQVRAGMPINLLSAGQAGATAPAALAGALAQALAECLSALTCVNLLSPGHPCVMGLWPFVSDLRTGAMSGGGPEEAVLGAASAQLANWLGLPSGVAAGMADSKVVDAQAGAEKALTITLAAQAGANLVYESAGMLASLLSASLEALVVDNDILGAVNRTIRGVDIDRARLSADVIADVTSGAGHFLGHPQTLAIMETEYLYPKVGDRQSPDDWIDAGATTAADRAHRVVVDTLSSHRPRHVSGDADDEIRRRFPIRLDRSEIDGTSTRW